MTRRILPALLLALAVSPALAQTYPSVPSPRPKTLIALAGDSTVTDNAGWGLAFSYCMNDSAAVLNFSKGGRSSGSFLKEGRWAALLQTKPDVVLIQFGHNDQPGHPDRESDPQTTYKQNLRQYLTEARAANIKPVLVTPLSRREWKDGDIQSSLTPYATAVKELAAEEKVPLINLHDWSIDYYRSLTPAGVALISPAKLDKAGNPALDGTHLNESGSHAIGPYVAVELRTALPEISRAIRGYAPKEKQIPATRPANYESPKLPKAGPLTAQGAKTITVSRDGSADFKTVHEAVGAAPENNADRTTIRIRPGTYHGQIIIPANKPNLTLEADSADSAETTTLTYALNVYDPIAPNVPDRLTGNGLCIFAANTHVKNLTIQNTSGDHGQAMAVKNDGDRSVFTNCRLLGWQDTLLAGSNRQYYKNCYIEGRVDFIYGGATAVFDHCQLHSKNGGYVTAASTPEKEPFGYVFLDCTLTGQDTTTTISTASAPPAPTTHLGRPWRPYAAVAFLRCEMGPHIKPEAWNNWGKPENEKTARYAEYQSTGPGANPASRAPWSKQLTPEEAATYTPANILKGPDNWNPTRQRPTP